LINLSIKNITPTEVKNLKLKKIVLKNTREWLRKVIENIKKGNDIPFIFCNMNSFLICANIQIK
jgi:hypothetical protein